VEKGRIKPRRLVIQQIKGKRVFQGGKGTLTWMTKIKTATSNVGEGNEKLEFLCIAVGA